MRRKVEAVIGTVHALSRGLALLAGAIILLLLAVTLTDAGMRNLGDSSIRGVLEWSETLLVVVIFLGLPYTMHVGGHVAIDSMVQRMPAGLRGPAILLGYIATLPVLVWTTKATIAAAIASFQSQEVRMGMVEIPLWPARSAVALGAFLLTLEISIELYRYVQQCLADGASDQRGEDCPAGGYTS